MQAQKKNKKNAQSINAFIVITQYFARQSLDKIYTENLK